MPGQKSQRIILIGFMATGKSAVGKLLAKKLGWKHLDCDALVERSRGMSVRRIFEAKGEAVFRAAVMRQGVPVSDVLQVWLDVSTHL